MFREEMRVLGLPGAEDVTDGSVDYCTSRCKCSGNLPDQSDDEAYEMTLE